LSKKDKLSEQDKKDWKDFLDNPLSFFEKENLEKEHFKRPKRFKFDLHGFSIENANKKVNEIINQCCQEGFSEILFITEARFFFLPLCRLSITVILCPSFTRSLTK